MVSNPYLHLTILNKDGVEIFKIITFDLVAKNGLPNSSLIHFIMCDSTKEEMLLQKFRKISPDEYNSNHKFRNKEFVTHAIK